MAARAGGPLGGRRRARRAARARRTCGIEAPFAVAFKNVALAAAVGGSLLGSVAALPGLLGFPVEILYFLYLARRRAAARRESVTMRRWRPTPSTSAPWRGRGS